MVFQVMFFMEWPSLCGEENNDTGRIDSWSTLGLIILPHQSQPIRKTPTFSDLTLECRTKTNHLIYKNQQVLRRFHPSLVWEAWGTTRVPSCFLTLMWAVKAQKDLLRRGWLLTKSQENSTHITLAVWFYWDCGTCWEYNSLVRPHFKLGLWNWTNVEHWAQRWISINCCSSWGKDTLTLCWNWRDWGAHGDIWCPLLSVSTIWSINLS